MSDEKPKKLIVRLGERFGVDPDKLLDTLKLTAFRMKDGRVPTNEEMMALLIVADQHGLNPFCREIYAFLDKQGGIMPVVGVQGWERIINQHPQCDGIDWNYPQDPKNWVQKPGAKTSCFPWITCILFRKDRSHPTQITEFLDEAYRAPFTGNGKNGPYTIEGPWQTHPKRMLRHKALIQCAQAAFGFSGIYEPDEAERAREMGITTIENPDGSSHKRIPADIGALESQLRPLIERARETNAWQSVHALVRQRFSGEEQILAASYLQGAASLHRLQQSEQASDASEASSIVTALPATEAAEVDQTDGPVTQDRSHRSTVPMRKRQVHPAKLPDCLEAAETEAELDKETGSASGMISESIQEIAEHAE